MSAWDVYVCLKHHLHCYYELSCHELADNILAIAGCVSYRFGSVCLYKVGMNSRQSHPYRGKRVECMSALARCEFRMQRKSKREIWYVRLKLETGVDDYDLIENYVLNRKLKLKYWRTCCVWREMCRHVRNPANAMVSTVLIHISYIQLCANVLCILLYIQQFSPISLAFFLSTLLRTHKHICLVGLLLFSFCLHLTWNYLHDFLWCFRSVRLTLHCWCLIHATFDISADFDTSLHKSTLKEHQNRSTLCVAFHTF